MRYIKLIVSILFTITNIHAQDIGRLIPGDQLPELTLYNILNNQSASQSLKLLSGKALILDFGSTGCAPCIASLQKFQRLMSSYDDKLQVVSVTSEKQNRVEKFLKSNAIGKELTIPIIYEDTTLHQLFPHLTTPHLVWIDKSGKIVAFTNHDYVTPNHIQAFIDGEKIDWPVKWDFPLDISKPLRVWNNQVGNLNLLPKDEMSFFISSYIPGVQSKYFIARDTLKGKTRILAVNQPIPELYLRTMGRSLRDKFMGCQILTEDFMGGDLIYHHLHGPRFEWMLNNTFSYEMYLPSDLSEENRNTRIRMLLDQYFPYTAELVDSIRDVCVISWAGRTSTYRNSTGDTGVDMKRLLTLMNDAPNAMPTFYINTGKKEPERHVQMDVDIRRLDDFEYLEGKLNEYGYRLGKEKRTIETLVIRKQ